MARWYTRAMHFFIALALIGFTFTAPATAAAPLIFRDSVKNVREQQLLDYFKQIGRYDPERPFAIASADLNGDGVEEWIFRQNQTAACEPNADCAFAIGGLSDNKIVLLGEMRGGKIGVSDEKLYGVRKLLVYNKKNDDFAYDYYVWAPYDRTFTPE